MTPVKTPCVLGEVWILWRTLWTYPERRVCFRHVPCRFNTLPQVFNPSLGSQLRPGRTPWGGALSRQTLEILQNSPEFDKDIQRTLPKTTKTHTDTPYFTRLYTFFSKKDTLISVFVFCFLLF